MNEIISMAFSNYDLGHLYRHLIVCFILFLSTVAVCIIDFISGIYTAKKLGEPLRSRKLRMTVEKISWYWLIQLLGFILGLMGTIFTWYEWPYVSMVIAVAIIVIEGKSVFEHSRRRKCRTAKIPETIRDIAEWIGDDALKDSIHELAKKRVLDALNRKLGADCYESIEQILGSESCDTTE
ncbi:hypothetical protein E4T81_12100 [Barnesiella sp. WM24]|uniref:phage holin family protein n=1 Tax=Barnesiella sp. WM24 TaxID=2558278 RepID=UPI00107237FC|nr:phage holin family protein [Barnesiella sp. WM24]TFU92325.1 hypothetical protein E4T81_12100 [Barnesiella sp. WM24]